MRDARPLVSMFLVLLVACSNGGCNDPTALIGSVTVDGDASDESRVLCIGSRHRLRFVISPGADVTIRANETTLFSGMPPETAEGVVEREVVCTQEGEIVITVTGTLSGSSDSLVPTKTTLSCVPCPPKNVAALPDRLGDRCDSISIGTATFASPRNDVTGSGAMTVSDSASLQGIGHSDAVPSAGHLPIEAPLDTSGFACGQAHESGYRTVCADNVLEYPAGATHIVAVELEGDVPAAGMDEDHHYIYAAVFDSDGQTANDWIPQGPYDWDYFQGTDRWYQVIWDTDTATWSMEVSQVSSSQTISPVLSAARAVVSGNTVTWFIPASELPSTTPRYRVSAFGHDGNYSASDRGGDVSGENPTEAPVAIPAEMPFSL